MLEEPPLKLCVVHAKNDRSRAAPAADYAAVEHTRYRRANGRRAAWSTR